MSRRHQAVGLAGTLLLSGALAMAASDAQAACNLQSSGNKIKHVIHITFDNVHLRRDNPNVPSDLEQMPNLLNFVTQNGLITGNHRTPLISHTANDILTALTGVYGDRHGVPVANSYGFFRPNGTVGFSSSFLYWTSPSNASVANGDGLPNMLTEDGKNHPAPWVPFTRAGCDVGAYSVANMEFETVPGDVQAFFGPNSQQATAINTVLAANPNDNNFAHQKARQSVNTDWLGIALHCAQGSPLCGGATAVADTLPDEPGGYSGFNALFGSINVAPVLCQNATAARCDGSGNVKDINGNVITDGFGRPGFPNIFSPTAAQSLGYAATMLERGVQVVYIYIADVHDRNPLAIDPNTGRAAPAHAFGPGEAEYVAQLKAYDDAFGKFFARLAADGITKENTLFLVVPDENDHFVGSQPTPVGCDGIRVPCNYTFASEIDASLNRLLATQRGNTTPFAVHSDDAPTVYITGNPAPTAAVTRTMAHDLDALTTTNPITSQTDKLSVLLADPAEMKLLHMVTASPARTPTLTMFGNENNFFSNDTTNAAVPCTQAPSCIFVPQAPSATFAWNHGDFQRDITRSWVAMAGPGVRREGRNDRFFSDHTDVRPTMLALVGLKDSYVHDGRVMAEWLDEQALPNGIRRRREDFIELATVYKDLNATLGALGRNSLRYANRQISGPDSAYAQYLTTIGAITTRRDALATTIKTVLDGAAFGNQPVNEQPEDGLGKQARRLIDQVEDLAEDRRRASR
jgi:hypothetical protein